MLGRSILLFTSLLIATAILSGAWFGRSAQAMPTPEPLLAAQNLRIDRQIPGEAAAWLDKAIERFNKDQSGWLHVKFRQTVRGKQSSFVAQGFLQTGPRNCVRREMEVNANGSSGRVIAVSDGQVLAKVHRVPPSPEVATIDALPRSDTAAFLEQHGCGGPAALLRSVRGKIQNAEVHAGNLDDRAILRITGDVPATSSRVGLVLDGKSFMLLRYDEAFDQNLGSLLQIDFLDCEIGRELSVEECARMFSYQPTEK